jgi:hypothetical protein
MADRTQRANETQAQDTAQPQEQQLEEPSRQRFVGASGGNVPPVEGEDENVRELKRKVLALVNERFHGDMRTAFDHYGKDGSVDKDELRALFEDAGVGNRMTRGMWVKGVMEKMDASRDGKITWDEFQAQLASDRH